MSDLTYAVASALAAARGHAVHAPNRRGDGGAGSRHRAAVHRAPEHRRHRRRSSGSPTGRRRRRRDHAVRAGRQPSATTSGVPTSSTTPRVGSLDNGSAILEFLRTKRGFCVQFASAYAVMARSLGIPARVAVGFTPGTQAADGRYHVTSHDAHAWPEICLDGLGWTHLFDPTPAAVRARRRAAARSPTTPSSPPPATGPDRRPPPRRATSPTAGGSGTDAPSGTDARQRPRSAPDTATSSDDAARSRGWWSSSCSRSWSSRCAYVGAVLVAKRRRRARRSHAADPRRGGRGRVGGGARPAPRSRASPRSRAHTDRGRASVPARTGIATAPPLHELARVYSAARYGDGVTGVDDARDAWTSLDELEDALDDGVSWSRRWRRRLDLSTLRTALTGASPARASGPADSGWPSRRAQLGDERAPVGVEGAHLGLDLVGEAVDRDEQRELSVAQRVEDLAVVATRPHRRRRRSPVAGR